MNRDQILSETIERASLTSRYSVDPAATHFLPLTTPKHVTGKPLPNGKPDPPSSTSNATPAGGALTAGGQVNLFSRQYVGLLANYAAVGVIYGAFPRTVYPFLNNYLNMDGFQAVAAYTLVTMPWSFKTFIGIVSDSFPIFGYRRRPYIVMGWTLCLVMLIVLAILPVDPPYYLFPEDSSIRDVETIPLERLNLDAPGSGSKYILLMMFASLFYVIADVCCDGVVVELAMREPEATRGTTQTYIYLTRTLFSVLSIALIGFAMNGKSYGGEFNFSLQFNEIMAILAVACAAVIPFSLFCLQESKSTSTMTFKARMAGMWKICQQRVIWQIMAYKFFSGIFSSFGVASSNIIAREWAHVQPLNDSIFTIVGQIIFAATLYGTKKYGLGWDWRRTIAITTVFVIVVDSIVSFLTIFDVVRDQWFWLGVPILEELPVGVRFIVSTYVCVEIADEGYEAATYGLITTVSNLATPFASVLYKFVDSYFRAFQDDIKRDDSDARMQVAWTFIIMYIMKAISLVFLVWLPRQKAEAQLLKQHGKPSALMGALSISVACVALVFSIVTNLMSIYPSTACYQIAGGAGCDSD